MSHALVRGLRARGVDVATALEEGMIERDDEEHLEFAAKANRALYSFNVADFYYLHSDTCLKAKNTQGSSSRASNNSQSASNCVAS